MNKQRRIKLKLIISRIEKLLNTVNEANSIKNDLEDILSEEEMAFDNLSEGLQCTMRGEDMEEAIEKMSDAIDCLNDIDIFKKSLELAIENIDEII